MPVLHKVIHYGAKNRCEKRSVRAWRALVDRSGSRAYGTRALVDRSGSRAYAVLRRCTPLSVRFTMSFHDEAARRPRRTLPYRSTGTVPDERYVFPRAFSSFVFHISISKGMCWLVVYLLYTTISLCWGMCI